MGRDGDFLSKIHCCRESSGAFTLQDCGPECVPVHWDLPVHVQYFQDTVAISVFIPLSDDQPTCLWWRGSVPEQNSRTLIPGHSCALLSNSVLSRVLDIMQIANQRHKQFASLLCLHTSLSSTSPSTVLFLLLFVEVQWFALPSLHSSRWCRHDTTPTEKWISGDFSVSPFQLSTVFSQSTWFGFVWTLPSHLGLRVGADLGCEWACGVTLECETRSDPCERRVIKVLPAALCILVLLTIIIVIIVVLWLWCIMFHSPLVKKDLSATPLHDTLLKWPGSGFQVSALLNCLRLSHVYGLYVFMVRSNQNAQLRRFKAAEPF